MVCGHCDVFDIGTQCVVNTSFYVGCCSVRRCSWNCKWTLLRQRGSIETKAINMHIHLSWLFSDLRTEYFDFRYFLWENRIKAWANQMLNRFCSSAKFRLHRWSDAVVFKGRKVLEKSLSNIPCDWLPNLLLSYACSSITCNSATINSSLSLAAPDRL